MHKIRIVLVGAGENSLFEKILQSRKHLFLVPHNRFNSRKRAEKAFAIGLLYNSFVEYNDGTPVGFVADETAKFNKMI